MKFNNIYVHGFEPAFSGMRNPMNSWKKSDSIYVYPDFIIGKNDMNLAQRLIKAGPEHRKFLRQIKVWVDITAPLYWWKEFDTYKVGITTNSTSTMHKLATTPIRLECFERDDYSFLTLDCENDNDNEFMHHNTDTVWSNIISELENLRKKYLETKDIRYWKELIRLLPESWLQTRTVTMNYENIRSIYKQRRNHKLTEWSKSFVYLANALPYSKDLITYGIEEEGD